MNPEIEIIYSSVLPMMKEQNISDTPKNRCNFLITIRDGWMSGRPTDEVTIYIDAINEEIAMLKEKHDLP